MSSITCHVAFSSPSSCVPLRGSFAALMLSPAVFQTLKHQVIPAAFFVSWWNFQPPSFSSNCATRLR